jgi:hypothetical protein
VHYFRPALHDRAEVDLGGPDLDSELAGLTHLGEDVGGAQHRLRRNTGVIEAAPADRVLLDHGGRHAELRGANRRHVAARAEPMTTQSKLLDAIRPYPSEP